VLFIVKKQEANINIYLRLSALEMQVTLKQCKVSYDRSTVR